MIVSHVRLQFLVHLSWPGIRSRPRGRSRAGERERSRRDGWDAVSVIGRLEKTVIDCPDPRALAEFYCQVLGMRINEDIDGWVVIGAEPGRRELAFQRATEWIPPRWPDPAHPQQLHLDIRVSDADQAERELLALGAHSRSRRT